MGTGVGSPGGMKTQLKTVLVLKGLGTRTPGPRLSGPSWGLPRAEALATASRLAGHVRVFREEVEVAGI